MTAITQLPTDQVVAALRRGTGKDDHRRAAEELLIEHDSWLRRASFLTAAVMYDADDDAALVRWSDARDYLGTDPRGSTSELAVLDLAVALGTDLYRFTAMGHAHRSMIRTAVTAALGHR